MDAAAVVPPYVAKPLELLPFRAIMLAPRRVGDPASARALARPYRDVSARLTQWIDRGFARGDTGPALYLHEYTSDGLTVRGLIGALRVSARADDLAERAVWPHEGIHPDQAQDLADRMLQMELNPAPILLVHQGHRELRDLIASISTKAPDWRYLDRAGQRQRLWAIRDTDSQQAIARCLEQVRCLLADGHHRYAAYLRLQEQHPGTAWDAGLAMIVDQSDTPLFLGAIHRTVNGLTLDAIVAAAINAGAQTTELDRDSAMASLDATHAVLTDGTRWLSVGPLDLEHTAAASWLHENVLPPLAEQIERVSYHHSVDEALSSANPGSPAILLPGPTFAQVTDIVQAGGLLPEKATSFQPKPSLGVIMRPMNEG